VQIFFDVSYHPCIFTDFPFNFPSPAIERDEFFECGRSFIFVTLLPEPTTLVDYRLGILSVDRWSSYFWLYLKFFSEKTMGVRFWHNVYGHSVSSRLSIEPAALSIFRFLFNYFFTMHAVAVLRNTGYEFVGYFCEKSVIRQFCSS